MRPALKRHLNRMQSVIFLNYLICLYNLRKNDKSSVVSNQDMIVGNVNTIITLRWVKSH